VFDRLLVETVQAMFRASHLRERSRLESLSALIATQTAFISAALRGKWRDVEHFDPLAASRKGGAAPVSRETARAFLDAARRDQLPGWVLALAPVREIRAMMERN